MKLTYFIFLLCSLSSCFHSEEIIDQMNVVEILKPTYIDIHINSKGNIFLNENLVAIDSLIISIEDKFLNADNKKTDQLIIKLKVDDETSMKVVSEFKQELRKLDLKSVQIEKSETDS